MSPKWSPLTKQLVIISSLIALIWLIATFSQIIGPLIVAIILAYFLNIPVTWLVRNTGWPRTAVVIFVYLAFLVLVALAPAFLTPRVVALGRSLAMALADLAQEIGQRSQQPIQLFPGVRMEFGDLYTQLSGALQSIASPFATGAITIVKGVASSLLWLGFVLVVSFWLVKDHPLFTRYIIEAIPTAYRTEIIRLGQELAAIWDGFVRGQLTVGIIVGLIITIVLWILGMPNAIAFGFLAGVMELIPSIGPTVAGLVGSLAALLQGSSYLPISNVGFALLVGLVFVVIFQLDNVFLIPRFVGRRVRLHPMVVFIGLIAGAQVAGVLGMLLASPTIASFRVFVRYIAAKLMDREPFGETAPADQEERWRGLVRGREVKALLFDLDGTLVETDDELVQSLAIRLAPLRSVLPALDPVRAARRMVTTLEGPANLIIASLDQARLDEPVLTWLGRLQRWSGYRPADGFITVPGAVEALRELSRRYQIGIVTTRREEEARRFVEQEGLDEIVRVIVARDNYPRLKPHPGPIIHAAEQLGCEVSHCAVVGDTQVDISAAQAAGALAIAVRTGFGQDQDFATADLVVDSVFSLLDWL